MWIGERKSTGHDMGNGEKGLGGYFHTKGMFPHPLLRVYHTSEQMPIAPPAMGGDAALVERACHEALMSYHAARALSTVS